MTIIVSISITLFVSHCIFPLNANIGPDRQKRRKVIEDQFPKKRLAKTMKSELETLVSLHTSENLSEEAAREINSLLRSGIDAAKNGNRDEAKALLFRVTDIEPNNEMAWLWLASVSEYPEELLTFLQKVLNLNPHNEQALEWERSTKALLARNLVQYGITAVQENKKESARRCFMRALETDENNEMAWLWMASISDVPEEKVANLKKVLAINPGNEVAGTLLKLLQKEEAQELLLRSKTSAVQGNRLEALEMLEQVKQLDAEMEDAWILQAHLSESFEEKALCFNQALACNPNNEAAKFGLASLESILQAVNGPAVIDEPQPEFEEQVAANEDILVEDSEEVMEKTFSEEMADLGPPAEESGSFAEMEEMAQSFAEDNEESGELEELYFTPQSNLEMSGPAPEFASSAEFASPDEGPTGELLSEVEESPVAVAAEAAASHYDEFAETLMFSGNGFEAQSLEHALENGHSPEQFTEPFAEEFPEQLAEEFAEESEEEAAGFIQPNDKLSFDDGFEDSDEAEAVSESSDEEFFGDGNELSFEDPEVEPEIKAETFHFGQPEENNQAEEPAVSFEQNEMEPAAFEEQEFESPEDEQDFAEAAEEIPMRASAPADEPRAFAEEPQAFAQGSACPFCAAENNINDEVCGGCQAVLGLHNMDMLLSQQGADEEKLSAAIERMESDLGSDDSYSAEEYFNLGLACLNVKNMDSGLKYLQKSYILNPTNSFLKAQIDELAKRMGKNENAEENGGGSAVGVKTIMVVDDSATIRKLVSAKLEKHGHNVVMAVDGMDALAKLEEIVPDLILLDITMPRLDGYQVCKLIRANDNTRFVPVVLISGKDGFFDKVRGKMCGSTTYITKPFGPEMLLRTVESYFE